MAREEIAALGNPEDFFAEPIGVKDLGNPDEFFDFVKEKGEEPAVAETATPEAAEGPILIPGIDVEPLPEKKEEAQAEPEEGRLPTAEVVSLMREEVKEGAEPITEAVEEAPVAPTPAVEAPPEEPVEKEEEVVPEETPEERRPRMEAMKAEMQAYEARGRPIPDETLERFAEALDRGEFNWEGLTAQMRDRFEAAESYKARVASWKAGLEEEKKESRWNRVWQGVKGAVKSWWRSISPQERNKVLWGAGVAVGLAESHAATMLLPGVGGWVKGIVNAAVINGANLALSRHYTREMLALKEKIESEGEEEIKQEFQAKYEVVEQRYSKAGKYIRDFAAGMAAGATVYSVGRIAWTVGEAAYNAYIRPPAVPTAAKEAVTEKVTEFRGKRLKLPVKAVIKPSVVEAAEKVVKVEAPVTKVAEVVEAKVPSFLGEVKIDTSKGAGNFWKAFEKLAANKIPGTNWINPENGVSKTDVINHAIIKLLRARGINIDLVHDGDVFKLMELLKPEEEAIIEKIAATNDVAGYIKLRPEFLKLLSK